MGKMNLYITRQLALATVFIVVVLTAAIWLMQSLRFVNFAIIKMLSLSTFFQLSSLLIPNLLSIVLPASLLIAVLFVYNRLIADNELVVMHAVGASPRQLLVPAFQVAVIVTVALYALNFYILPWSLHTLRKLEHNLRNQMSVSVLQDEQFNSFQHLTIYARKLAPNGEVHGVIIHSAKDKEKPFTITARKGVAITNNNETRLILMDGIRHDEPGEQGEAPSCLYFDQYVVDLNEDNPEKAKRVRKPYEYSTWQLLNPDVSVTHPSRYLQFIAQGHQRILSPLYAIVFVLIGLAVLLTGDINRRGRTKKNIVATGLCALVQVIGLTFFNLAEKIPIMIPLAYLFIAGLLGILLLRFYEKVTFESIFGGRL